MARIFLLWVLMTGFAAVASLHAAEDHRSNTWTPLVEIRVRQEILENAFFFAPETDRNWIRVRTRAGLRLDSGAHRFEARLTNGHRHVFTPSDTEFDWNELFIDHLFWDWHPDQGLRWTVGRQDIIWPGGFLLLDGSPLDGSRSNYFDAVRVRNNQLDLSALSVRKYDPIVLLGDEDTPLADGNELGFAGRWTGEQWTWSFLMAGQADPDEVIPDLTTATVSIRRDGRTGSNGKWHVDLAGQYQNGIVNSAYTDLDPGPNGWALAGEGQATLPLGRSWELDVGGFYYSGQGQSLRPFHTPWGRWPKWSELIIYTLIAESTPGRVHVAAWENIAAPRAMFRKPLGRHLTLRLGANYLVAPASSWEARGLNTQAELKATIADRISGHLLWETLIPGTYHDGSNGLPPLTDTVHFLRWQVMWTL